MTEGRRFRHPTPVTWTHAAIVLIVAVLFWPLTHRFFAQDDFVFMERAARGFQAAMSEFFEARPGQFRPLTKGVYFLAAWPAFGFHAFPYHLVSLLVHALNSCLLVVLMRRLGLSLVASGLAGVLFACNMAHLEAVAWVSCIQQLLGTTFLIGGMILALDAVQGRARNRTALATLAYAFALASYEQALALPIIVAVWQWLRHGWRAGLRAVRGPLLPMFALLLVYVAFMVVVKGPVRQGPYVMSLGPHIIENVIAYAGIVYSLWWVVPTAGVVPAFSASHVIWVVLAVILVARHRVVELVFGGVTFLLLLAPVLPMKGHTASYHVYVPAVGAWIVLAAAAHAVEQAVAVRSRVTARALVVLAGVICVTGSFFAMRENLVATIGNHVPFARSFVLRRSVFAERMCTSLKQRWPAGHTGPLVLVYGGRTKAYWINIKSALASGDAVRLLLDQPDLDVTFVPPAPMPSTGTISSDVMVYSSSGYCYTPEEWQTQAANETY